MLLHGGGSTNHARGWLARGLGLGRLPLTAKPNVNPISAPTALFISTPERVIFVKDAPGPLTNWPRNAAPRRPSLGRSGSRPSRYDLAPIGGPAAVFR